MSIYYCDLLQHDIDIRDTFPIKQFPHRPTHSAVQAEDDILDKMLIEPSDFTWESPVCLAKRRVEPIPSA